MLLRLALDRVGLVDEAVVTVLSLPCTQVDRQRL
jgi:hypothetical protein